MRSLLGEKRKFEPTPEMTRLTDSVEKSRFPVGVMFVGGFSAAWLVATPTRTLLRQSRAISDKRCTPLIRWWLEDSERQGFEVLHGGGENEFVAGAGKTSQSHTLEAVVSL